MCHSNISTISVTFRLHIFVLTLTSGERRDGGGMTARDWLLMTAFQHLLFGQFAS